MEMGGSRLTGHAHHQLHLPPEGGQERPKRGVPGADGGKKKELLSHKQHRKPRAMKAQPHSLGHPPVTSLSAWWWVGVMRTPLEGNLPFDKGGCLGRDTSAGPHPDLPHPGLQQEEHWLF